MTLKTLCNREVLVAYKDDTIFNAAVLMRQYHAGDVIIVEERNGLRYPVGIVTDRDIVIEVIAKELAIDTVTVGDLMCRELVLAQEDDDLLDAIRSMRQKGVRRLPVVDKSGVLVGIFAADDLIGLIAEQLQGAAGLIGKEQAQEKQYRY
ncbi:CBS domain-containing protein [Methylomicrobium album]|uniref:Putative transcriptional regulator, contains C-terminal CBS domains n=1 Tax=Methylomicrobium album BG8 TaxID=686340 RepID=H8GP70_METAL|nr:CBS domain-containing protein [Methylomicrobium album]EIC29656.1 putative transcriptional regulator, contains C-terminal CBS domains [Methylomicrobium album BG8]